MRIPIVIPNHLSRVHESGAKRLLSTHASLNFAGSIFAELNSPFSYSNQVPLILNSELSADESRALEEKTKSLRTISCEKSQDLHCANVVRNALPERILKQIEGFANNQYPEAVLHIKNLPLCKQSDQILLGIGRIIGNPYIEYLEAKEIVQHISPKKRDADLTTSASYNIPLVLHVENAGTDRVPDWVSLFCERNDEKAETTLVCLVKAVFEMLTDGKDKEVALLFDNKFWARAPLSFGANGSRKESLPILSGYLCHPSVMVDFIDMGSDSATHQKAFDVFKGYCEKSEDVVCLERGDLLVMRNQGPKDGKMFHQIAHGRKRFTPVSDSTNQRLLKRLFIMGN